MTPTYAWLLFDMQHLVRVVTYLNITVKDPGANIVPPFSAFRHPRTGQVILNLYRRHHI